MVKVSVIVPVYNAEKYLRQCLDSICSQTLSDIEIICVDDGSTDSSPQILKEYENADKRFRMITQENQYAGVARNNGMKHAAGEYLVFWDADDFYEDTTLEKMYEQIRKCNADICVCGGNRYFEEYDMLVKANIYARRKYIPAETFNIETNSEYILNFTNESVWNKMFRRSFIMENGLSFSPFRNGNDVYMVVCALCMAKSITVIEDRLVTYRVNQQSNLVGTMYKAPLAPFMAWMETAHTLKEKNIFPERSFVNKCTSSMVYLLRNLSNRQAFDEAVAYMKEHVLEETGIRADREEGYYYKDSDRIAAVHLCDDSPDELLAYLAYSAYLEVVSSNGRIAYKNDKIRQMREAIDNKNNRITNLKETVDAKNEKLDRLETKLERLNEIVDRKNEKIGHLEKTIDKKNEKINQLKDTIDKKNGKINQLKNTIDKKNEKIDHMNEVIGNKNTKMDAMRTRMAEQEQSHKETKRKLENIRNSKTYKIGQTVTWLPHKLTGKRNQDT